MRKSVCNPNYSFEAHLFNLLFDLIVGYTYFLAVKFIKLGFWDHYQLLYVV